MRVGQWRPKAFGKDRELRRISDGLVLPVEMALAMVFAWLAVEETTYSVCTRANTRDLEEKWVGWSFMLLGARLNPRRY